MTDGAPSAAPKSQLPEFPAALLQFDLPPALPPDRNNLEISCFALSDDVCFGYKMDLEWWVFMVW